MRKKKAGMAWIGKALGNAAPRTAGIKKKPTTPFHVYICLSAVISLP